MRPLWILVHRLSDLPASKEPFLPKNDKIKEMRIMSYNGNSIYGSELTYEFDYEFVNAKGKKEMHTIQVQSGHLTEVNSQLINEIAKNEGRKDAGTTAKGIGRSVDRRRSWKNGRN